MLEAGCFRFATFSLQKNDNCVAELLQISHGPGRPQFRTLPLTRKDAAKAQPVDGIHQSGQPTGETERPVEDGETEAAVLACRLVLVTGVPEQEIAIAVTAEFVVEPALQYEGVFAAVVELTYEIVRRMVT